MKRILVTGKNSYIGSSFKKWLSQWPERYQVDEISVRGEEWRDHDFSKYDSILHAAGIAHVSADARQEEKYFRVNRDLAIEVARKAKNSKVKQFIFLSSIIIYGDETRITAETKPNPVDFYGKSKLEADLAIQEMGCEDFKTAIVRSPMVYGPNCKGNFPKLVKLGSVLPVFPSVENKRSMIFIENLTELLRLIVDNRLGGIFFPQNKEYVSTKDIIQSVAELKGKSIIFTDLVNPLIRVLSKKNRVLKKVFGDKFYVKELSFDLDYNVVGFKESMKKSLQLDG